VARARAGGEADLRVDGDVVALIRDARRLRPRAVVAALPQTRDRAGRCVRKDARTVDDLRLLRRRERHLDHVDAEERGVRILLGIETRAAGELLRRADRARAGAVDVDVRAVARRGDERVRVRSAARLDRRDLTRLLQIADVEDADAA